MALMLFMVVMLALVCATFLNLSATALVSMLPLERMDLSSSQTLFRIIGSGAQQQVVIGGIASTSVIIIIGLHYPVAFPETATIFGIGIKGVDIWKLLLAAYVLAAVGLPVWLFLQSRDCETARRRAT
jgi:carbon starvation protein